MKQLILFFAIIFNYYNLNAQNEKLLVPFSIDGKFGFRDSISRDIVIPAKYDLAFEFINGKSIVVLDGLHGCIDKNENVIIPFKYNFMFSFFNGLALVKIDKKWGFIDENGKEIIPLKYDKLKFFHKGLACAKINSKWGYIDKQGNAAIPIKYDWINNFSEGFVSANKGGIGNYFWDFKGGKWGFIDTLGNEVIPFKYDTVENFSNGIAYVKLNNEKFFINKKGEKIDSIKYGDNIKNGRFINIRGFNMYYETYGSGFPLILIHGNGGSINNFSNQIPYFSKLFKIIVADNRAHGKSIDLSDSLSYEMMADDYNLLLDSLKIDSCSIIGWSDGGIIGLLLAIRHSKKITKLAITGANLWPDTTAVDPFIYNWAINENEKLKEASSQMSAFKNNSKVMHLLSYEPNISVEQIKMIQCPTLVIGGDHDVINTKHTLLIAETIPKSYLWIIPNSGHSAPVYQKEQFNNEVSKFLLKPYKRIEGFDRFK